MSKALRSPSIKATSMRYSPVPLPFADTGEYIVASASFEQVCQLLVKGQPAERNGRRLAPLCFLSHPASSCHLLHASCLGCNHWQIVRQHPAIGKVKPAFTTTNPR